MTTPTPAPPPQRSKASEMLGARRIGRRLTAPGPKRILAIDGGGTRGIVAIRFLAEIERTLQKKLDRGDDFVLSDYFDLVGGTSVGALIATLVALGWRVDRIEKEFTTFARDIFRSHTRSFAGRIESLTGHSAQWLVKWRDSARLLRSRARFDERALVARIGKIVDTEPMASDRLQTGLAVVCKRGDTNSVWIMTNNPNAKYFNDTERADDKGVIRTTIGNGHYVLADVLRASTAAPTIFKPVEIKIHDADGHKVVPTAPASFIDGGVSPHNSPALQMFLMAALREYNVGGPGQAWPVDPKELLLVSVGTGRFDHPVTGRHLARRAVTALEGMIKDNEQLGLALLQSMSEPRLAWKVDSELSTLAGSTLGGREKLSFQRYDLPLEQDWLEKGDKNKGIAQGLHARLACLRYPGSFANDLPLLKQLDAPEMIDLLGGLAAAAARDQVDAGDFPGDFDSVWTDPEPYPALPTARRGKAAP